MEKTKKGLIKALRLCRGLTQKEMAQVLGVNQSQYSKIETGIHSISVKSLIALTDYFKISMDCIKYHSVKDKTCYNSNQEIISGEYLIDPVIKISCFKNIFIRNMDVLENIILKPEAFYFEKLKVNLHFINQVGMALRIAGRFPDSTDPYKKNEKISFEKGLKYIKEMNLFSSAPISEKQGYSSKSLKNRDCFTIEGLNVIASLIFSVMKDIHPPIGIASTKVEKS